MLSASESGESTDHFATTSAHVQTSAAITTLTALTSEQITRLFLYGMDSVPADLTAESLIRAASDSSTVEVDAVTFMSPTGPGRFALASEFELVQEFFEEGIFGGFSNDLMPGVYTKQQVAAEFGLGFFGLTLQHVNLRDAIDDYVERTYIYNTQEFEVFDEAQFIVTASGDRFIENFSVVPGDRVQDNFDFVGGGLAAAIGNGVLEPAIDPSGIGRTVNINYVNRSSVPRVTYRIGDFNRDESIADAFSGSALLTLRSGVNELIDALFDAGVTKFLDGERPIFYGTVGNDNIEAPPFESGIFSSDAPKLSPFFGNGFTIVAGPGGDTINGDPTSSKLLGGTGDDTLIGGGDSDMLVGGMGTDRYRGTPQELNSDTIVDLEIGERIEISIATIEQSDVSFDSGTITIGSAITLNATVPSGASLRVLDETLPDGGSIIEVVGAGQDLGFVIDTTGSMVDDIDAVKASSNAILEAIFDPDRGLNDSRVAVVGYNDPSASVILPFTDQNDPSARKAAAAAAINGISVDGGGDIPEFTYTGLLRALDGSAGEWREEALSRKIILFGDAPAKDGELRSQIEALAADVGIGSTSPLRTQEFVIGDGAALVTATTLAAASATGRPIPVQIFTVIIGFDPTATSEFRDIAAFSGGRALSAADASEIVDALLEVINLPIFTVRAESITVQEGDGGVTAVDFTILRNVGNGEATVSLSLGGTADADDIASLPASVTFANGELSKTVTIEIRGDRKVEDDETLTLVLTGTDIPATIGIAQATTVILDSGVGAVGILVAAPELGAPQVKVFNAETKEFLYEFTPYREDYRLGVRVATGDVNGDGVPDIAVAPGMMHAPLVRVYDGRGPEGVGTFTPLSPFPVAGDFDGSGLVDAGDYDVWINSFGSRTDLAADSNGNGIVDSADYTVWRDNLGNSSSIAAFASSQTSDSYLLGEFMAYDPAFIFGVNLSIGDVTGDGVNDIVVSPSRGAAEVRVFENAGSGDSFVLYDSFLAYPSSFIGGATIAVGDLSSDGRADIVTSTGAGSLVNVKVFDATRLRTANRAVPIRDFMAFDASVRGGASIAIGNVLGDATADIVLGAGQAGGSRVQVFDGALLPPLTTSFSAPALEFLAYSLTDNDRAGVHVAVKDYDEDGVVDAILTTQGTDGESGELREFDASGVRSEAFASIDKAFADQSSFFDGLDIG